MSMSRISPGTVRQMPNMPKGLAKLPRWRWQFWHQGLRSRCRRIWRWVFTSGLASVLSVGCISPLPFREVQRPTPESSSSSTPSSGERLVLNREGFVPVENQPSVSISKQSSDEKQTTQQSGTTPFEKIEAGLSQARELFRKEEYSRAETIFERLSENKHVTPQIVQEALYHQAECLRLQGHYPRAADLYSRLLKEFPQTFYRDQAIQRMFDIANYWLDDTREEMREDLERQNGQRWFVWPRFFHLSRSKPFIDREGRALQKLDEVRMYDLRGPLAPQALFMCGTVKLYHQNFQEADRYFSQLVNSHPDHPLAIKAIELAILCKNLGTGGSVYDGRRTAEARQLVQAALFYYPTLANEKKEELLRQLEGITLQEADKEYQMAEFYRRIDKPGSAYWYYDLVRRRYPNTRYAQMATERMNELRVRAEREGHTVPDPARRNNTAENMQRNAQGSPIPLPGDNRGPR